MLAVAVGVHDPEHLPEDARVLLVDKDTWTICGLFVPERQDRICVREKGMLSCTD